MNIEKENYKRYAITFVTALIAIFVLTRLWSFFTEEPWTRDGRIRADVIAFAPDVSGRVTEVLVHDNQLVKSGDVLFRIDKERLKFALARAEASVLNSKALRGQAEREAGRYRKLDGVVSEENRSLKSTQADQADAAYNQATSDRDLAALNLERADVRAPADGIVTNFSLRPGAFVTAGVAVTAFIATDSYYVAGYFEENKLSRIHVGDLATVRVMGEYGIIKGKVESISAGIEDRERTTAGGTLLSNINPTFNWVRLPQRVPVRISINEKPPGLQLVSGRTATVSIEAH